MMRNNPLTRGLNYLLILIMILGCSYPLFAQQSDQHPFEEEIEAFEQADQQNPPPEGAILFVGSSSIRMWKSLQEDFPNKKVINRGFGGSQFTDLLYYDDRIVIPYKPRQIFVYEGDNDINAGVSPQKVFEDFKTFVGRVNKKLPDTEIVFISIKPSPSRIDVFDEMKEANRMIETYTEETENVSYVDIFNPMLDDEGSIRSDIFIEDNLHMNDKGYDIWQRVIRPYLD